MRSIIFTIIIQMIVFNYGNAQTFQVDTLQYKGDINKCINIVIMGDGYTISEQNSFISDATFLSKYLLNQSPFSNYINYFNVFAIRVISSQSGTKHPRSSSDCSAASPLVPVSNPSTHLGCSFDSYGIHRLVVPTNTSNIVNVLATNFPNYDQILIIANTSYYGGSGGNFATSTRNSSSNEVTSHEIGHSFANLADEYYAGDIYFAEKPNMTKQTNPVLVKWKNWMTSNGIGIYSHCCGGQTALWYRPHNNCKMRYLGAPFCHVCKEAIIEKIHSLVNPLIKYTPSSSTINSTNQFIDFKLTELLKPISNTLKIIWKLDEVNIFNNIDSIQIDQNLLTTGTHILTATIIDTTSLISIDNHSTKHFSVVTWTINKTTTNTQLLSSADKIKYSVYPNPSSNLLNFSVESEQKSKLLIQIISLEGKIIEQISAKTITDGKYSDTFNIEHLANGTYVIVFKLGSIINTQTFIKQ